MTTFPGVATIDEARLAVMVGLDDARMTLISGEKPIGEWPAGQFEVVDLGAGSFEIRADDDRIAFHPDDPDGFSRFLRPTAPSPSANTIEIIDGPPPKPLTLVGFWLLVALTAALGTWAVINLLA